MIGHDPSEPIPRQKVAHSLIQYMKENGLQREGNRRMIDASGDTEAAAKVRELFGDECDWDTLDFFNMQKLLKPLMEDYAGSTPAEAADGAPEPAPEPAGGEASDSLTSPLNDEQTV